ncbi:MAG TPA: SDR family NAD(P)-dependent oxidoreductase [Acetobacteraceae bacterium]|nr:SDR family NAD(P)-dependent oxidoreductase [Acetobacteraceae bacterium]
MELSGPHIALAGHRVLVTGAARGLGRGMAEAFAAWGASVAVADLDAAGAAETLARIRQPQAAFWAGRLDVTDAEDVARVVEASWSALGAIDLLVNNAGILSVANVADLEPAEWRRVMEVNATGTFLVARAVVRAMLRARHPGSIVSIASIAARRGDPGLAHYSASKFAVIGFTQALAREVAAHGITVNAVCPGVVRTAMIDALARDVNVGVEEWIGKQAISRAQTAEDVAFAVAFLHRSRAVTGQAVNVDGGSIFS